MNARLYLQSHGWKDGEALQKGGLKKPILVKHKKDTKGLGSDSNDSDMWWEKLFDGQLQNLDVNKTSTEVSFKTNDEAVLHSFNRALSPLYEMFVKGEGLKGTVGELKSKLENNEKPIPSNNERKKKKKSSSKIEKKESKKVKKKIKKEKKDKKEKKKSKKNKI
ncbi:unnamed protein product [Candida verbasci]|uniref:G-patch domain-containing protein n=1 Tax=Candida verbasci TaxID=1227364 RepID=A0A9W4TSW2_9ASCO|nr:unnamed protein product [Candida verbasci]